MRKTLASMSVAIMLVSSSVLAGEVDISSMRVYFDTRKNTIYFHDTGWFESTDYPIKFFNGVWNWQRKNGQWSSLPTPFITKWNAIGNLILNIGGRITVHFVDNGSNVSIRLINGEWNWCPDISTECSPLYEMYED